MSNYQGLLKKMDMDLRKIVDERILVNSRIKDRLLELIRKLVEAYEKGLLTETQLKNSLLENCLDNKSYYVLLTPLFEQKPNGLIELKKELVIHLINESKEEFSRDDFIQKYEQNCLELLKNINNKMLSEKAKKVFSCLKEFNKWLHENYLEEKRKIPEKTIVFRNRLNDKKLRELIEEENSLRDEEKSVLIQKIKIALGEYEKCGDKRILKDFVVKNSYGSTDIFYFMKLIIAYCLEKKIEIDWLIEKYCKKVLSFAQELFWVRPPPALSLAQALLEKTNEKTLKSEVERLESILYSVEDVMPEKFTQQLGKRLSK